MIIIIILIIIINLYSAKIRKFTAMIILHFHLTPQFTYELFHMYLKLFLPFTVSQTFSYIQQLLNEAEQDMKNSADQGGCCPQRPKAEVDNTLRDLQNSSYPTIAEFNNCFIIHSKYFLLLKGVSPLRSLFFRSPNITQPCPQVFSVNDSIISGGLYF